MAKRAVHYRPGIYQRGEDTRRRLIETALEVFAAEGYEGATTRVLAKRAAVKLPAIPYYFGSKEGLYRAVVDDIVDHVEAMLAPTAKRVRGALKDNKKLSREASLALLSDLLDAMATLFAARENSESVRVFLSRAEIERETTLAPLHQSFSQHMLKPCAELIGRLTGKAAHDQTTMLRTMAILGQVQIFCSVGARRKLGWRALDEKHVHSIQKLVREQTEAIFRDVKGPRR
jgi:AcrR family transcriptional regulator